MEYHLTIFATPKIFSGKNYEFDLNKLEKFNEILENITQQSLLVRFVISSVETRFRHETVVFLSEFDETSAEIIVSSGSMIPY